MQLPHPETEPLTHLIRHTLGCTCPAEVFEYLRFERPAEGFDGLPVDALARVGGRLLVGFCLCPPWQEVERRLEASIAAGRQLRDAQGYNRFRLVVVTDDKRAEEELGRRFTALPELDERLHLHVIPKDTLPTFLRQPPA